ncbi:MAG: PEP-CTERM sorting domain-containing protein [Snowella sp.]|nr:PEP-CTERM sorting domain-containing protein [Snowella sp.]
MNVCTRIALISSLSAVASLGLLTTEAKAFSLVAGTIDVQTTVTNPPSGSIFPAPATVTGKAVGSWNVTTDSAGTFNITWIFKHALEAVQTTVETFTVYSAGGISGTFSPASITATGLSAGIYETTFEGIISTNEFGVYESNKDRNRWTVSQPVPEPLTILSSATALGFGAFLKRKQKAAEKKS